jgi:hypothetical protein
VESIKFPPSKFTGTEARGVSDAVAIMAAVNTISARREMRGVIRDSVTLLLGFMALR